LREYIPNFLYETSTMALIPCDRSITHVQQQKGMGKTISIEGADEIGGPRLHCTANRSRKVVTIGVGETTKEGQKKKYSPVVTFERERKRLT